MARRPRAIVVAVAAVATVATPVAITGSPPTLPEVDRCHIDPRARVRAPERYLARPDRGAKLPPTALRGVAHRLHQYPRLRLATPAQRAAAACMRSVALATAARWPTYSAARASGFDTKRRPRRAGDRRVYWFHAEHSAYHHDDLYLAPSRPDTLIYADVPGHRMRLVGVMFSMPRGFRGPTPGGPITRWHWHEVCARGGMRGEAPRGGSCPRGTRLRQGSEMMHIWFTRDLRSAYAIHAPEHELCIARLLPRSQCRHDRHPHPP